MFNAKLLNINNKTVCNDFRKRAEDYENISRWVIDKKINSIPLMYLQNCGCMGNILDAGGGTGYLSCFLSQKIPYRSISLVDLSLDMLRLAENKRYNVNIFHSSIEEFCDTTTKTFDTILIRQVLHYVDDVNATILSLKSVLKENGLIYVGQILVDDQESRIWHDILMKNISKNRKRTFLYNEFLALFNNSGLSVIDSFITDFEDSLKDSYNKIIDSDISYSLLKDKMESLVNDTVRRKMLVRIEDNNLYFTVKFCHLFLRVM